MKEIIRANFIFVQVYFDTAEGKKLIHYYHISTYPFIAILDPRTGEKLEQFNNPTKLDQCLFCEKVTEFLGENELNVSLSESQEQQSSKSDDVVSVESSSSSSSVITSKDKKPVTNGNVRVAKQTAKDVIKAINEEDKASTSKQNGRHKHDDDLFSADESDEEKPIKPKMTNGFTSIKSVKSSTESKKVPESKKVVETIKPSVILPLSSRFETPDTLTKGNSKLQTRLFSLYKIKFQSRLYGENIVPGRREIGLLYQREQQIQVTIELFERAGLHIWHASTHRAYDASLFGHTGPGKSESRVDQGHFKRDVQSDDHKSVSQPAQSRELIGYF